MCRISPHLNRSVSSFHSIDDALIVNKYRHLSSPAFHILILKSSNWKLDSEKRVWRARSKTQNENKIRLISATLLWRAVSACAARRRCYFQFNARVWLCDAEHRAQRREQREIHS